VDETLAQRGATCHLTDHGSPQAAELDTSPPVGITRRIPAEIAEQMRRLAKQHDRSLNGEIVRALREYTEKHDKKQA
jgi:hypothetical protein